MKLTIATTALLFAGSLQASIIQSSSGLGLSAGPSSYFQNFSVPTGLATTPTATSPGTFTVGTTTGTAFSGLTVTGNTTLYYDPNGGSSCNLGNGVTPMPSLTACIGDYNLYNATATPLSQAQPQSSLLGFQPDLDLGFSTPVFSTSFLFAVPSAGAGSLTYNISVYTDSTKSKLLESANLKGSLTANLYLQIAENTSFSYIDITQLQNSGTTGAGTLGYGNTGYTFNAVIGNVQASTVAPEPATMGLLGLGLAGLGYVARRRKQA